MKNPGLPDSLWSCLDGRLWHATDRAGIRGITSDKKIRVAVGKRYLGSFCRNQGGVCLFDFGPSSENLPMQFNNLCEWFGYQQGARVAVWLGIDRALVSQNLLDAAATRKAWETYIQHRLDEPGSCEPGTTIISGVEACHKGAIPLSAISSVLFIFYDNTNLSFKVGILTEEILQEIDLFERTLPPEPRDSTANILMSARQRMIK